MLSMLVWETLGKHINRFHSKRLCSPITILHSKVEETVTVFYCLTSMSLVFSVCLCCVCLACSCIHILLIFCLLIMSDRFVQREANLLLCVSFFPRNIKLFTDAWEIKDKKNLMDWMQLHS